MHEAVRPAWRKMTVHDRSGESYRSCRRHTLATGVAVEAGVCGALGRSNGSSGGMMDGDGRARPALAAAIYREVACTRPAAKPGLAAGRSSGACSMARSVRSSNAVLSRRSPALTGAADCSSRRSVGRWNRPNNVSGGAGRVDPGSRHEDKDSCRRVLPRGRRLAPTAVLPFAVLSVRTRRYQRGFLSSGDSPCRAGRRRRRRRCCRDRWLGCRRAGHGSGCVRRWRPSAPATDRR